MQNQTVNYCGDKEMVSLLEKAGAKLALSQVYGLLYGGLAAPHPVMPQEYMAIILGSDSDAHITEEEVKKVFENIQALWSIFSQWIPETEPIALPDLTYSDSYAGLADRLKDDCAMIEFFIKGLDTGHAAENDFGEGGITALKQLSEISSMMHQFAELIDKDKNKDEKPGKELDQVNQMEELSTRYIATMISSLEEARIRVNKQIQMMTDETMKGKKIPRNEPCPCGSGKKYKNCCGVVH